jgi:hypothetical protein
MGFKMTDILPPAGWPNVRQLETNEFANGGANGNMNEQAKSLAARSELLKQYAALPYESKMGGYALNERVQLATGDIVRSTIASNVNNPNVNMTGWEVPSLKPEKNLSDVPDKAAARSNLSVYSQAQVDTAILNATPTIPNATETVAGKAKIATTAIAQAGLNDTDFITSKKLRDALNASGNAPTYACRAWVNFNGEGVIAIRASGNVGSITDLGVGIYQVNLIVAMPHANYAVTDGSSIRSDGSVLTWLNVYDKTTTYFKVKVFGAGVTTVDAFDISLGVIC